MAKHDVTKTPFSKKKMAQSSEGVAVSWATAQLTPTPFSPTNPRALSLFWRSRDTFIMTRQAAIVSYIEVRISTDLPGEGTSNCSNDAELR